MIARLLFAIGMMAPFTHSVDAQTADLAAHIKGGKIVTIADGDFLASSYATGRLAPTDAPHKDLLTVIVPGAKERAKLEVSNSVTSPPEVMSVSGDGRHAFVVERLGQRRAGIETVRDLAAGKRLFAVNLEEPAAPKIVDTVEAGPSPEAVRVSPDGRLVAVVANASDSAILHIASFAAGRFGSVASFRLSDYGIVGTGAGPRGGVTATFVDWHPSGRYVAVNLNTQNRVVFFEVTARADGSVSLQRWGNAVEVGRDPFVGRFTPDGRHYVTADWGRNFAASSLEERLPMNPSAISVIRLGELRQGDIVHRRIAGVDTDRSSEGIAVSPDGRLIATINMRETGLLPSSPRFTRHASVTLLSFDPDSGEIQKINSYPFEGVLPEGAAFDLAGEHLLVTVYEYHDNQPPGGGLEVWRVVRDRLPRLEHVGRIPAPHGTHHVEIAK
jgi:DNA-binding beta-propeller fold protein YncE